MAIRVASRKLGSLYEEIVISENEGKSVRTLQLVPVMEVAFSFRGVSCRVVHFWFLENDDCCLRGLLRMEKMVAGLGHLSAIIMFVLEGKMKKGCAKKSEAIAIGDYSLFTVQPNGGQNRSVGQMEGSQI